MPIGAGCSTFRSEAINSQKRVRLGAWEVYGHIVERSYLSFKCSRRLAQSP